MTMGNDLHKLMRKLARAFYQQFDGTDGKYYYVVSIMDDNTMVVEDDDEQYYFLTYQHEGDFQFTFQPKDQWTPVESTFVPLEQRAAYKVMKREMGLTGRAPVDTASRGMQVPAASVGDNRSYSGYGIVFNSDSTPLYINVPGEGIVEVVERITPQSVADADMTDVFASYNHEYGKILGRTSAGTMTLETDERGIKYNFTVPDTTYGHDLIEVTRRGDIRGSSFTFSFDLDAGYEITERADGALVGSPLKITQIHEMGPVVNPAYPQTTAESRSSTLAAAVQAHLQSKRTADTPPAQKEEDTDHEVRSLEIEQLEM